MQEVAIQLKSISKQYRLGLVGSGSLTQDLNRTLAKIRGKEDPYLKIGARNELGSEGGSHVWALKDVNLDVPKGEVLGIVGKNGAGKSTLLKVLSRVTAPTEGFIKLNGRIASLLEVGTGFHPELTGRENIYLNGTILGMTRKEIRSKFDEIVEFSGVKKYIDTPVKRYSSGMYVRLAFAVAAHLEPEILIIDEVLAVGDAEFQQKALGKMQDVSRSGRTVLFVSHNLASVEQLCTSAILVEQGTIKMQGDVPTILDAYKKSIANTLNVRRSGTQQAEFVDYKLLGNQNKEVRDVTLGEDFNIVTRIRFNEELGPVDLSLDIRNDTNEFISHITNMDDNFRLNGNRKNEIKELNITIRNVSLAPGTYQLSLWLGNKYGTYDYHENCIVLKVNQGEYFIKRDIPFDKRSKAVLQSNWKYLSA